MLKQFFLSGRYIPIILNAGLPCFGGAAGLLGPAAELEESAILGGLNWKGVLGRWAALDEKKVQDGSRLIRRSCDIESTETMKE